MPAFAFSSDEETGVPSTMSDSPSNYVSRGGKKLARALEAFAISPKDSVCADLGSSTGGFVDCLLQHGAAKVFAVERGYGVLAYSLREDPRVVVMERRDALHVRLPEPVKLVTIDTGWTRQIRILPVARRLLAEGGHIISLVKPHYEAEQSALRGGVLPDEKVADVLTGVRDILTETGLRLISETESPIRGRGGNQEYLWLLSPER